MLLDHPAIRPRTGEPVSRGVELIERSAMRRHAPRVLGEPGLELTTEPRCELLAAGELVCRSAGRLSRLFDRRTRMLDPFRSGGDIALGRRGRRGCNCEISAADPLVAVSRIAHRSQAVAVHL